MKDNRKLSAEKNIWAMGRGTTKGMARSFITCSLLQIAMGW
jgi:hypothetical protein